MNTWAVNYRLVGCTKFTLHRHEGDGHCTLRDLEKNSMYDIEVTCTTPDGRVFVKPPKKLNSGPNGEIGMVFKGISRTFPFVL